MSPLSDLIEKLRDAIAGAPERAAAAEKAWSASEPLTAKLPLVHRTGDRRRGSVLDRIFVDGYLRPPKQPSSREADLELAPAVYFNYGAGNCPRGNVALVFPPPITDSEGFSESTFTYFDSGALGTPRYLDCPSREPAWEDIETRRAFLREHTWPCKDLTRSAEVYLAAHFKDHRDYVRLKDPDWPPYHGLTSATGDPRAWTIEVRNPKSVPLEGLEAILLDRALLRQISDTYLGFVRLVEHSDGFDRGIADYIEENHCQVFSSEN